MAYLRRKGSGSYEVRYRDGLGRQRGRSFKTRTEAKRFLGEIETELASGAWRDPALGKVLFGDYAGWWLENRPDLRPRTVELYESLLRVHLVPTLGDVRFDDMSSALIRAWHAEMLKGGRTGRSTVAHCYRLLRTILNDAVQDELLVRNPCAIRGAGVERPAERPIATVAQVYALAEAIAPRYRAMVLVATFCGLRMGECLALRRGHVDLVRETITVREQAIEMRDGTRIIGPPKTAAGVRVVSVPPHMADDLTAHLARWVAPEPDALVFTATGGGFVVRNNFRTRVWLPTVNEVGLVGFRFHDLRHTGNTLAASTGASTKELMARMGHASSRAALIYQHATEERDIAIARSISDLVVREKRNVPTIEDSSASDDDS